MNELTVGVVYTAREWRTTWQRYVRDHVVGVTLRLVRDSRMAKEEHLDVLIVDDDTSYLTPPFVAALRERGVRIVGVFDDTQPDTPGAALLQRLGVDRIVAADVAPEDLLAVIEALRPDGLDDRFEEVVAGLALDEQGAEPSQVLAVGGPPGSGATEVAVALADVASRHQRTVLVDVDEVAPGIARRLQLGLHPHLLTALDDLRGTTTRQNPERTAHPLEGALARPAAGSRARLGFDVVAGLANRGDWHLLRGDEIVALLDELARWWRCVVANLGPHLEDLSPYVERFVASRSVVTRADRLIGVCEASPRGLLRFLDWLVEVAELAPDLQVDAVVNRTPGSRHRQAELEAQLHEDAGPRLASVNFLAEDAEVSRAAWDGVVVPRGSFRKGVLRLGSVVLPPQEHRRRFLVGH